MNKIKRSYAAERFAAIGELQEKIWDGPEIENEDLRDLLSDLASDLNFYEPVERDRDESLGYYGDEKLIQLIENVLDKIEKNHI